jgi:D-alanyl-D-alanine carboxypeptidase
MGRRWFTTARAVCALVLLGVLAPSPAAGARPNQTSPPPKAFIVVNASTGAVLSAHDEHDAFPPASIAKIMTALGAAERLPDDAMITVSDLAAAQPASRINMVSGHQWRFEDAMASLMMVSANDAAYALAENAGGSLDGFAKVLNSMAKRMKMKDSTFSDPAGFDDAASFKGGPRMSAYDIAIATRNALTVPEIAKWASTARYQFDDPAGQHRSLLNHNKMLPGASRGYEGATGFKTGYTKRAGHTFVATAGRNGCTLIVVVLNTYDVYTWASALLDQAFAANCEGGSGAHLPGVAVSPYGQRVEDRSAFLAVAQGPNATTTSSTVAAPTTLGATTPTNPAPTTHAATPTTASGTKVSAAPIAAEKHDSGGGLFSARNLVVFLLVLAIVLVVLRRRAVRRQRARRLALRRQRNAKLRSGALPVVDGRYRTGTRTGDSLESHVRIHRVDHDE